MRKNTISRLLNQISSDNNYLVLLFALLITSSAWSFFLTSVSTILITAAAILNFWFQRRKYDKVGGERDFSFKKYFPYVCVSALFFLTVLSGLWSENSHDYLGAIRIKAPLFVLPLSITLEKNVLIKIFQRIYLAALAIIFIALHIISARSGLLILYASILVYIIRLAFIKRQYLKHSFFVLVIALIPIIAFYTVDSFHQKINYFLWDRQMQQQGDSKTYSDGERWVSNEIGIKIFKENKLLGTGVGDFWDSIKKEYTLSAPSFDPKMPHNQFIVVAASFGILGLMVFLFGFLYNLNGFDYEILGEIKLFFYLNMLLAFCFDVPLEAEFGIVFYAFFASLLIKQNDEKV
jgi:O-antigen ligase